VGLAEVYAARDQRRFDGHARTERFRRVFDAHAARLATVANRVQARHGMAYAEPFADRRLIEFVLALPQWQVQRRGRPKTLLRDAMIGILPDEIRGRLEKRLPTGLYERGMRDREVATVRSLLADSRAAHAGWLDAGAVRDVYEAYLRTGRMGAEIWWPLTVEMWLRRWWT
jgi:asparagine synthase (glutamine-hydrolysing)